MDVDCVFMSVNFDHGYEILCVYECTCFLFIGVCVCLGLSITMCEDVYADLCVMSMSTCECVDELLGSFESV